MFHRGKAIAFKLDRLPHVYYFNPDCSLLLSLSCSKVTVIFEPSGFFQTNVATVAITVGNNAFIRRKSRYLYHIRNFYLRRFAEKERKVDIY
ncbi:hypothetical protein [Nostoc sp. ChiVER01]|uniref:hypothetical protein n=1 Tax=Nostoc sp. ChiVER01 TaxID=3075382 RepID=UPI002AD21D62|nr:hypothetical protein [Nostoc sp. ChiVER01]MDZ8221740.1 hypothetical protein [Nostoc sp. ChiVER01]